MRLLVDKQGSSRQGKKAAAELKAGNLLGPNHHHHHSWEHLLLLLRHNHDNTHTYHTTPGGTSMGNQLAQSSELNVDHKLLGPLVGCRIVCLFLHTPIRVIAVASRTRA